MKSFSKTIRVLTVTILILVICALCIFIYGLIYTLINESSHESQEKNLTVYSSDSYQYNGHSIHVELVDISNNEDFSEDKEIVAKFYYDDGKIALFSTDFYYNNTEYEVIFEESNFEIVINNNYDYCLTYNFDYDDVIRNFTS